MKVSCNRESLLSCFQIAESITPRKTSKPILKNVKLEARGENVIVTATNIEMTMRKTVEAGSVGEEGTVLISGRDMAQILRECDAQEIFIDETEGGVMVNAGDARFTIQSSISEDFFSVEHVDADFSITAPREETERAVNRTIFTTGTETLSYTFSGVLFNVLDDRIEVVGTDGKRIAIAAVSYTGKVPSVPHKALVSVQALRILLSILAGSGDENVEISFAKNSIVFRDSTTELRSQLLEGRFPEYAEYIPREYEITAGFDRQQLASGIRKADIMTSQETHLVVFSFDKESMVVTLTARCLDRGTSEVTVPMVSYEGEDIKVGFDGRHLLDVLRVLDTETVTWKIKVDDGPGQIDDADAYRYVFMPVKIR